MWQQDNEKSKRPLSDKVDGNGSSSESTMPTPIEGISALVGKGVNFKGTITYDGLVQIDGLLEGKIHTEGVFLVGYVSSPHMPPVSQGQQFIWIGDGMVACVDGEGQ